jgi:hypothetical protein
VLRITSAEEIVPPPPRYSTTAASTPHLLRDWSKGAGFLVELIGSSAGMEEPADLSSQAAEVAKKTIVDGLAARLSAFTTSVYVGKSRQRYRRNA